MNDAVEIRIEDLIQNAKIAHSREPWGILHCEEQEIIAWVRSRHEAHMTWRCKRYKHGIPGHVKFSSSGRSMQQINMLYYGHYLPEE
jgi:hypothetical protein